MTVFAGAFWSRSRALLWRGIVIAFPALKRAKHLFTGALMKNFLPVFSQASARIIEILGISVILFVAAAATGFAIYMLIHRTSHKALYHTYRHMLARGILLGLELLVGADIINTVTIDLSYQSVGILAIIVAIRTFLSFTLEVEMTGRWPWQNKEPRAGNEQSPAR